MYTVAANAAARFRSVPQGQNQTEASGIYTSVLLGQTKVLPFQTQYRRLDLYLMALV